MKSPFFLGTPLSEEKRLLRLSFAPSFRRLCFSFSSSRTLAVSEAVAAFLMPPLGAGVVPWGRGICVEGIEVSAEPVSAFFLRFLPDPEAFFRE